MKTFAKALVEIGFRRSRVDPCLFVLENKETGGVDATIVVYVDDAAIGGLQNTVDWVKAEIAKKFKITDFIWDNLPNIWEYGTRKGSMNWEDT